MMGIKGGDDFYLRCGVELGFDLNRWKARINLS